MNITVKQDAVKQLTSLKYVELQKIAKHLGIRAKGGKDGLSQDIAEHCETNGVTLEITFQV